MQLADILAQMGGLQSVAQDLGVSQSEVATGAQALLPVILGGFKKQAQASPAAGLADTLEVGELRLVAAARLRYLLPALTGAGSRP